MKPYFDKFGRGPQLRKILEVMGKTLADLPKVPAQVLEGKKELCYILQLHGIYHYGTKCHFAHPKGSNLPTPYVQKFCMFIAPGVNQVTQEDAGHKKALG